MLILTITATTTDDELQAIPYHAARVWRDGNQ